MNVADGSVAIPLPPIADVVVVGPEHDDLFLELRVAPFDHSQDVAAGAIESLKVRPLLSRGRQSQPRELLSQIIRRRLPPTAARLAPLQRIVRQKFNVF